MLLQRTGYKTTTALSTVPLVHHQLTISQHLLQTPSAAFSLSPAAMFVKTSFLAAGLMASTALGHALHKRDTFGCGAPEPSEELLFKAGEMATQEKAVKESGIKFAQAAVSVPTWFHVVAASESEEDGYVSVSALLQPNHMRAWN